MFSREKVRLLQRGGALPADQLHDLPSQASVFQLFFKFLIIIIEIYLSPLYISKSRFVANRDLSQIPALLPVGSRVTCKVDQGYWRQVDENSIRSQNDNLLCQGTIEGKGVFLYFKKFKFYNWSNFY